MKKYLFLSFFLTLSFICQTNAKQVTGIAAKVNGRVITINELNYHLTPFREQLEAQIPKTAPQYKKLLSEAQKNILDGLIERELILSEFKTRTKGRGIPQNAIDQEIERQIRELYNNNRAEFIKALKESGISAQQHRRSTEEKLIVQAMRSQQFRNSTPPLPSEVQKEYYKARKDLRDVTGDALEYHKIYLYKFDRQNPAITPKGQFELAKEIIKKLNDGADFAELAKKHSQDSYAEDGGKVGKTKRTDLSAPFAAILMDSEEGGIVGPLEDPRGFTIVRLDKKHYGPAPPLSKVRPAIENRVRAQKNKAKLDRWIKRLRSQAMIKINI